MKKINNDSLPPRRRKGLQLTERELAQLFSGGTYQLETGHDFVGALSTAANQLREAWRAQRGNIAIVEDPATGTLTVTVTPPTT